jgi:hypothetical protein
LNQDRWNIKGKELADEQNGQARFFNTQQIIAYVRYPPDSSPGLWMTGDELISVRRAQTGLAGLHISDCIAHVLCQRALRHVSKLDDFGDFKRRNEILQLLFTDTIEMLNFFENICKNESKTAT